MNDDIVRQRKKEVMWHDLLLVNMAMPLYFMLQEPMNRLIPGLLTIAVIALLHMLSVRREGQLFLILIGQLALIAVLGFCYHTLYVYLIFLLAYSFTQLKIGQSIPLSAAFGISVVGMLAVQGQLGDFQMWLNVFPPLFGGCALPYIILVSGRYREMAQRLQAATKQIERFAQQEERQRIAQELHDTLGHTLSLIALKGNLTAKLVQRAPDQAVQEAEEIRDIANNALKRMRELVSDMKAVRLDEEWEQARMLCAAANVKLEIQDGLISGQLALTPLQESVLAMCVREALTNVIRHSGATACQIALDANEEAIRCIVTDNGKGLEQGAGTASFSGVIGNGLVGMKQRLALLEGQLHVVSERDRGTRIEMVLPIVRRQLDGFKEGLA